MLFLAFGVFSVFAKRMEGTTWTRFAISFLQFSSVFIQIRFGGNMRKCSWGGVPFAEQLRKV